jgi:hypothetical protein
MPAWSINHSNCKRNVPRLFALAKEAVDHTLRALCLGIVHARREATRNAASRSATPAQIRAIYELMESLIRVKHFRKYYQ